VRYFCFDIILRFLSVPQKSEGIAGNAPACPLVACCEIDRLGNITADRDAAYKAAMKALQNMLRVASPIKALLGKMNVTVALLDKRATAVSKAYEPLYIDGWNAYIGDPCKQENPCQNGGDCTVREQGQLQCVCKPGFYG
jgi:hypothetical protein